MKKELRINKSFSGYKPGEIVPIECDKHGVPLVREWRNRVKDSAVDNCVEFVVEKKKPKKSTKNEAK